PPWIYGRLSWCANVHSASCYLVLRCLSSAPYDLVLNKKVGPDVSLYYPFFLIFSSPLSQAMCGNGDGRQWIQGNNEALPRRPLCCLVSYLVGTTAPFSYLDAAAARPFFSLSGAREQVASGRPRQCSGQFFGDGSHARGGISRWQKSAMEVTTEEIGDAGLRQLLVGAYHRHSLALHGSPQLGGLWRRSSAQQKAAR
uniref:DUF3778 domain-containing protein n=1 Tax=Oryza glaberrima TaxID=4538 RepID=I1Q0N7_ORYGL